MDDSALRTAHKRAAAAIGRGSLTVHDLRRTAATLAAEGGATTAELMRLLGHTTVGVAMLYQVPEHARDRARAEARTRRIEQACRCAPSRRGHRPAAPPPCITPVSSGRR